MAESQGAISEVSIKYKEYLERCGMVLEKGPDYWRSNPTLQLIAQGESKRLEFKETLEADNQTGEKNLGVLASSLKSIAAFLNTDGGTLIIGVSDAGYIKGLKPDYSLCIKKDKDGFEQKLRSLIATRLVPQPFGKIAVEFDIVELHEVCRVEVGISDEIIHLDHRDVYVRDGNTSRKLEGAALTSWIRTRTLKMNGNR